MKTKYILIIISFLFFSKFSSATVYTWSGAVDTVFAKSGNWGGPFSVSNYSPYPGYPTSNDTAIIVSATNRPVLATNYDIAKLIMTSGDFDLKGFTFTTTLSAEFSGGTLANGNLIVRGTKCEFYGTSFNVTVEVEADQILLSGGTFNERCKFTTTGVDDSYGAGGCVFNGNVKIYHHGTSHKNFVMGTRFGDTFNGYLKLYNQSNGHLRIADDDSTYFNGNVEINNAGDGLIYFGFDDGYSELALSKTMSVGDSGFVSGEMYLINFQQKGSTAQMITLTDSALIVIKACIFEGDLILESPEILCSDSQFEGTTQITKSNTNANYWGGNNIFGATTTISYQGTGGMSNEWGLAASTPNIYKGDVAFESNGNSLQVVKYSSSEFHKNVSINNSAIEFIKGVVVFKGDQLQHLNGSTTYNFEEVLIDKTSQNVVLDSPVEISNLVEFKSGNFISDSTNMITFLANSAANGAHNGSFVSGPVKKVGDTEFEFPVGKNGHYRPVGISAPDSIDDAFVGEYFNEGQVLGNLMDSSLTFINKCTYWNLQKSGSYSNVDVKFAVDSLTCDFVPEHSIKIGHWNGSKWQDKGKAIEENNFITINDIHDYGSFTFVYSLDSGDFYHFPQDLSVNVQCNAAEYLIKNRSIWFHFSPDSIWNTISINKPLNSKNYAFISNLTIFKILSQNEKMEVARWTWRDNDSLQKEIVLNTSLDTSSSYLVIVNKMTTDSGCTFCDDDSTYINICISSKSENVISAFSPAPQNPSWSQPPYRLNFNATTPAIDQAFNLPITPAFSHNIQQDLNGNILFYVIDGIVYNGNGLLIQSIECNCINNEPLHGKSEFLIVPVPGDCNKYYLISSGRVTGGGTGNHVPFYVIYDVATEEVYGTGGVPGNPAILIADYFNDNQHSQMIHFAASKLTSNNIRYLFISSPGFLHRYVISSNGILLDTNTPSIYNYNADFGIPINLSGTARSEMELKFEGIQTITSSAYGGSIALPLQVGSPDRHVIFYAKLDYSGKIVASSDRIIEIGTGNPYPKLKGLEFSPDGKFLYVTTQKAPFIYFVDLSFSIPVLAPLLNGTILNGADFQNSQIEWAHNNKLYLGSGNRMASIDDPNNPFTTTFSDPAPGLNNFPVPIIETVGYGVSGDGLVILPDQIDGEFYGHSISTQGIISITGGPVFCTGITNFLTASNGFAQYAWSTNELTQTISPTSSGLYTVVVTDNKGCQGSATVDLKVKECCAGTLATLTGDFSMSQLSSAQYPGVSPVINTVITMNSGFDGTPSNAPTGQTIALNGTLTINWSETHFEDLELILGEDSKIIFTPLIGNEELIFVGKNYLHGCGSRMWDGIYLDGSNKLNVTDDLCWIEDAKNAIVSYNGGDFQLRKVHFNRNWKSLVVNMNNTYIHSGKVYDDCKFTTELLFPNASGSLCIYPHSGDIGYRGIEINGPGIFQVGKPLFVSNKFKNLKEGIFTNRLRKGTILECEFENISQAGIYSVDSKLNILGNKFKSSTQAIRITNISSSSFNNHTISGNEFIDVNYHIVDFGGRGHYIGPGSGYGKNFFGTSTSSPSVNFHGLFLLGTSGFSVLDNDFFKLQFGTSVFNSGSFGGYIGYKSYGNIYTDCGKSVFGAYNNSNLTIRCNQFYTNFSTYYNARSWDFSSNGTMADQGIPGFNYKNPAGNRWFDQTSNHVSGYSSNPFSYYSHDPDPPCISFVRLQPISISYNYEPNLCFPSNPDDACGADPCDIPCLHERIGGVTNEIDSLKQVQVNLTNYLSEEAGEDLIDEIKENETSYLLYEILINATPLSDTVLLELSRANSTLSSSLLRHVFERNTPLSVRVLSEIEMENTTLDSSDKILLIKKQANYLAYPTYTGLQKQINKKVETRQYDFNELLRFYSNSDSVVNVMNVLTEIETEDSKQNIFSSYMTMNLLDSAQTVFNELEMLQTIDTDWLVVQGLFLTLALNGKSVFDIDSVHHATLYAIAEKTGASTATANARSWLKLVYNENFEENFDYEEDRQMNGLNKPKGNDVLSAHEELNLRVTPNPANKYVAIQYKLPLNSFEGILEIIDITGKPILKKEVDNKSQSFLSDVSSFTSGMYVCKLSTSTNIIYKKFVVFK